MWQHVTSTYQQLSHGLLFRRQFFTSKYQELNQDLFSANAALFPAQQFTFERFLCAVAAVRSRTHPPLDGDDIAIVPGLELVSAVASPVISQAKM
jgi:hypothetical protein